MYLYLGETTVIPTKEIIGIFDMDNTTVSGPAGNHSRNFLRQAEKKGQVVNVSYQLPKSFVVTAQPGQPETGKVYVVQLSPATLLKRSSEDIL